MSSATADRKSTATIQPFASKGEPYLLHTTFELALDLAKSGNTNACLYVALSYETGRDVVPDSALALHWYRDAAARGDAFATSYLKLWQPTADYSQLRALYRKLAIAPHAHAIAQYGLAWCHQFGLGVEADDKMAHEWLVKSAELGFPLAQCALASFYSSSLISRTWLDASSRALVWTERVSDKSFLFARFHLAARHLSDAKHIPRNDDRAAFELYQTAASAGNARAQVELAKCFASGRGTAVDEKLALEGWKRAADQQHADGLFLLAQCYTKARGVEARDDSKAFSLYRLAAEHGHCSAQYSLGSCYFNGLGVEKDDSKAVEWFRRAADQHSPFGLWALGLAHLEGRGVDRDLGLAVDYLRRAGPCAFVTMGECYAKGVGVPQDHKLAFPLFFVAAARGNPNAQYYVGLCYEKGHAGLLRNERVASEWYSKALGRGHAAASNALARLCVAELVRRLLT